MGDVADLAAHVRTSRPRGEINRAICVSLVHRYAFFACGKVANSSLKYAFFTLEVFEKGIVVPEERRVHIPTASPLLVPYQLPDTLFGEILTSDTYRRITFVRRPYERLLSCYLDRIAKKRTRPSRRIYAALGRDQNEDVSFSEFLRVIESLAPEQMDSHWRPLYDDLFCDRIEYDFIGRFENLAEDFEKAASLVYPRRTVAMNKLGYQSPKPTDAASKTAQFYTAEDVAIVRKVYAKDFEYFGYDPDL